MHLNKKKKLELDKIGLGDHQLIKIAGYTDQDPIINEEMCTGVVTVVCNAFLTNAVVNILHKANN